MFVQVVSYSLEGISEDAYLDVATGLAPRYAGIPGLLAKIWLENPGGNRYGAVYFWEDAESMERFGYSDLFEGDTQEFGDFVSEEFRILENLTAQTQPVLEILESRGAPPAAASAPSAAASDKVAAGTVRVGPTKRTPPPKRAASTAKGATKAATKAAKAAKVTKVTKVTKVGKAPAPAKGAAKAPTAKAPAKKVVAKKAGRKATR